LTIDKTVLKETTLKEFDGETFMVEEFTFRNPNVEVGMHYKSCLLERAFGLRDGYIGRIALNLRSAILEKDSGKMTETLGDLHSGIVHLHRRQDESYCRSIFQAVFVAAGLEAGGDPCGFWSDDDISFYLDGKVIVVFEVEHVEANSKGDKGSNGNAGSAAKELASALDKAENAIRDKNPAVSFSLSTSDTVYLALAVRGRDEVAARFLILDGAEGRPSS
jgi:hypothetical protein